MPLQTLQPQLPLTPELDLDHSPALEEAMRTLFEMRWKRWHREKTYEAAVADPVTRRLLYLQVLHSPSHTQPRQARRARR